MNICLHIHLPVFFYHNNNDFSCVHLQRYPVIPVSHVWTNQSSFYIGFSGGQIMMVDFESSSMKMQVNQVEVREIILTYMYSMITVHWIIRKLLVHLLFMKMMCLRQLMLFYVKGQWIAYQSAPEGYSLLERLVCMHTLYAYICIFFL